MRADGRAFLAAARKALPAAAAVAGVCAVLAGCSSGAGARAPAASALATRQAGNQSRPAQASLQASPSQAAPSQEGAATAAAGTGTPAARASRPAAPGATASQRPASSRSVRATLTSGLYTNAPDGTAHYVLSFTSGANNAIRGSASFLYAGGRIAAAGSYAATLSGQGTITLTFGDGKVMSGRYTAGRLVLAGCAAVLPLATAADGCTFTYHGHVP